MKQVVLKIDDLSYNSVMAFLKLCPSIEVINEYSDLEVRRELDICILKAIRELRNNKVIRKPSDYTYIMQAINEKQVKDALYFNTPKVFIEYLGELELDDLPSKSTIYDTRKMMAGEYPKWVFKDPQIDEIETLRRNNVARQFLSALFKAQRALSDGISENG